MLPISKTTFLQFQICPKDTWLRLHKPELVETFHLTEFEKHLLEQGNEVETCARQLFPGAVLVSATGDEAVDETRRLDGRRHGSHLSSHVSCRWIFHQMRRA